MVTTKEMFTKDGSFLVVFSLALLQLDSIILALLNFEILFGLSSRVPREQSPVLLAYFVFSVVKKHFSLFVFMLFWLLTILYFAISLKSKTFLRFICASFNRDVNTTSKCSLCFSKIFRIYFFLGNELLLECNQFFSPSYLCIWWQR